MNAVRGSNKSETKMIQAIQRVLNVPEDGAIGAATMSSIAAKLGAKCWPLTMNIYGAPTIIAEDIVACDPNTGCRNYNNSLSGSFSFNGKPCSILVSNGKTLCSTACHAWLDKPETVLYRLKNGKFGVKKCKYSTELPAGVDWAVGGVGLLDMYDPKEEGFSRFTYGGKTYDYSDVMRKTNHTVIGVKDGLVWLIYVKSMTGAQVNTFIKDKFGLQFSVMLDGGHVAAINGDEPFAKINVSQTQHYLIQGVALK